MKKNKMLHIVTGLVVVSFIGSPLAYAETNAGASGALGVPPLLHKLDADTKTDADGGVVPGAAVQLKTETSVKGGAMMKPMEDGVEDDAEGESEEKEHGLENAMMHANENAEDGLMNAELHVNVHALMESESKEGHVTEVEIEEADDVHSSADFEHFIAHKAKSDEHLKEVKLKDGKVEIVYAMPAKFLGFLGTTLDATMSTDASGNVSVAYPWYGFLMKKGVKKEDVVPLVEAEIKAEQQTDVALGTTTTPTMKRTFAAPHVFEAMVSVAAKMKGGWNLKENVK